MSVTVLRSSGIGSTMTPIERRWYATPFDFSQTVGVELSELHIGTNLVATIGRAWRGPWSVCGMAEIDSAIRGDEEVLLFPIYAKLSPCGTQWRFRIQGWIFELEEDSAVRKATLGLLRRTLGLYSGTEEIDLFRERARWFLVDNERGKRIPVRFGERVIRLPASLASGHFDGEVSLPAADVARLQEDGKRWIECSAITRAGDVRRFTGRVHLVGETGWSVISDIDDTIKITEVHDRSQMIANTFLRPYSAPPGMADLYGAWEASVSEQELSVHYVSNSPWQLYTYLNEFIAEKRFPSGTIHLRIFRWKDRSLVEFLSQGAKHKDATIEALLRSFPKRRFILVGDTGERDPEIYAEFGRKFPTQVVRIFLRVPSGEAKVDNRLRRAMRAIPEEKWQIFSDPQSITWRP